MGTTLQRRTFSRSIAVLALLAMPAFVQAGQQPDFNGDGHADLAIGVPGEAIGDIVFAGAVNVIYGSKDKLASADSQIWTQEDFKIPSAVGSLFGANLAWGDFNGDTMIRPGHRCAWQGIRWYVLYGRSGRLSRRSRAQIFGGSD